MHQQHVGKAKEHDIVVHEFTVLRGVSVHYIFVHTGTGRFQVRTVTQVEFYLPRLIFEHLAVAVANDLSVIVEDDAVVVIKKEAGILTPGAIFEDLECALGGAGTILTCEPVGRCMTVVPGTEEILHLVVVKVFVHRYHPDVFVGVFIVYLEITAVEFLQLVIRILQLIAVIDGGFPGVHRLTIHGNRQRAAVRMISVCPVVIKIYLRI